MIRPLTMALGALLLLALIPGCSTGDLGGTSWRAVEVITTGDLDLTSLDVTFGTDGYSTAEWTTNDGQTEASRNRYSVHQNSLLIIDQMDEDGDLHLLKRVDGNELYLASESFHARLVRTN